ncbi:MAG: RCS-specific HTH-type transcriptional activator RclR [Luteibacter sp.]|uniref:AraC family transcriptional regulator n=1 Tax=Luteibacter sp. TaxID=1886636 RepID=UPI001385426E|nr:AraC family transcriptional regulator [Luteibacter sp.]KAF1005939.1 MAG: RCS-specific HTH-type transcriptional activator RclR [Luteibacter sp.]
MSDALKAVMHGFFAQRDHTDGIHETALPDLALMRSTTSGMPNHVLYRPALCFVVQGAKQVMLGEDVLHYRENQALVVNVEMPGIGRVTRASAREPYMAIHLAFDMGLLREAQAMVPAPAKRQPERATGMFVDTFDDALVDCMLRLVRLLDTPAHIPALYPLLAREIFYRMLTGPTGAWVGAMVLPDTHTQRIAEAIHQLRTDFTRAVRVEDLAAVAGMSPSSFHQHFKAVTSVSPLQFQKNLRLLEARRLMVTEDAAVASAAYRVGYESASQFSREYTRMFGAAPKRDAEVLREAFRRDGTALLV